MRPCLAAAQGILFGLALGLAFWLFLWLGWVLL